MNYAAAKKLILTSLAVWVVFGCSQPSRKHHAVRRGDDSPASKQLSLEQLKSRADQLLAQMTSEDYRTREEATSALRKLLKGSGALMQELAGYLEKQAAESEDPEVKHRLKHVLVYYRIWHDMVTKGIDLQGLSESESAAFLDLLDMIGIGRETFDVNFDDITTIVYRPKTFFLLRDYAGKERYVLVRVDPAPMYWAVGSSATISIFDDCGKHVGGSLMLTGWSANYIDAAKVQPQNGRPELIKITAHVEIYLALVEDEAVLVRLEGFNGELASNNYRMPHHTVGPGLDKLTEKKLLNNLRNGTWVEKLAGLTWLGGEHMTEPEPGPETHREDKESAALAKKLLANEEVITEVKKLSLSKDKWIKEAADMVLGKLQEE